MGPFQKGDRVHFYVLPLCTEKIECRVIDFDAVNREYTLEALDQNNAPGNGGYYSIHESRVGRSRPMIHLRDLYESILPCPSPGALRYVGKDVGMNEAPVVMHVKKCECGVDSIGGGRHSSYCPKADHG